MCFNGFVVHWPTMSKWLRSLLCSIKHGFTFTVNNSNSSPGCRVVFASTFKWSDSDAHTAPHHKQSGSFYDANSRCFVSPWMTICAMVPVYLGRPLYSHVNVRYTCLLLCSHVIKYTPGFPFSAFKACHPKIKTFYFAAENVDDMSRWVNEAVIVMP